MAEETKKEKEEKKDKMEAQPKIPAFRVGDTVKVFYRIHEEEKERVQPFEGIVIAMGGAGIARTFTVRKVAAQGVGVERIFPLHSPNINKVTLVKRGKVRRAKLFYLRERVGRKATRIKAKAPKNEA